MFTCVNDTCCHFLHSVSSGIFYILSSLTCHLVAIGVLLIVVTTVTITLTSVYRIIEDSLFPCYFPVCLFHCSCLPGSACLPVAGCSLTTDHHFNLLCLRQIPTRLTVGAVGSDIHQAGLCLKPQLVRLKTITEPQLGYIYTVWKHTQKKKHKKTSIPTEVSARSVVRLNIKI